MLRFRVQVHFAFGYLVAAIFVVAIALAFGGAALVLLWPGLTFAALAAAYLTGSGRWLGKRSDGGVNPLALSVFLPYFAFARVALFVRRARNPAGAYNEVSPGIFVGRLPDGDSLPAEIDVVVDCTAEHFEPRTVVDNYDYRLLPTLDRWVAGDDEFTAMVEGLVADSGTLYVHCAAGKGRSATVAAALILARGLVGTVDEAESLMRVSRPQVGLHTAQKRQVERVVSSLTGDRKAGRLPGGFD